jgi:ABC-2 type transport system ATP-binding protein
MGKTVIMCSHRLEDVQDTCDRIAILNDGELQAFGEVKTLLQDTNRVELRASNVTLTDALQRDLEELFARHGGTLDTVGHPTTTLEDYFLHIVEESRARPGRRYLPEGEPKPPAPSEMVVADRSDGEGEGEKRTQIKQEGT